MKLLGIAVAVSMFAGCYAPSFKDCELACAGTGANACPDGLTCAAGACRLPGMTAACGVTPMIDAPDTCWPYTASTVDPCAADFPPSTGPLSVPTMMTIDTTAPSHGVPYLAGRYIVLHVDSVNVAAGAALTVTGLRPLIIVSDGDVDITGIVTVQPTLAMPPDCVGATAAVGGNRGAGGYGGGYGTGGGDGGGAVGVGRTTAGAANGDPSLDPLRPGCPGGRGGGPLPSIAGVPGRGGGALQITTKTQLVLAVGGTIVAGGGGGGGGAYATCAGAACTGGGGGGGTGGSILLEGTRVAAGANSRLCAVAGAGGNAPQTSMPPVMSGSSGNDATLCAGGRPGSVGIGAGKGADAPGAAGPSGGDASSNLDSGAGGGGGLGRIRIHSIERPDLLGTAIPTPAL